MHYDVAGGGHHQADQVGSINLPAPLHDLDRPLIHCAELVPQWDQYE